MAHCNWCNLESETSDFCIWCKRPIQTPRGTQQQARADLHWLRESEDGSDGPFPFFALIGAFAFIAVIVVAILSFRGAPKQADEGDHWRLAQEDQPVNPPYVGPAIADTGPRSAPVQATPVAPPPSPVIQQVPSTGTSSPAPSALGGSYRSVYDSAGAAGEASRFVKNTTIYFESVDFKFITTKSGKKLVGDVVVVNDTYGNLNGASLTLSIGANKYDLVRFDGPPEKPHILPRFDVSSKSLLSCHVIARGLDADQVQPGKRSISLDAKINGAAVHVQSGITSG